MALAEKMQNDEHLAAATAEEVKKDANEEKPMEGVESSQAQEPETTPE